MANSEFIKPGARANQEERLAEIRKGAAEKMNKWANKTVFSYYTKSKDPERQEGEEWEDENYRLWTMKDGKKVQISKYEFAKTPWWCPKCGKSMSHKLDDKFYRIRGACFNCILEYEHKIRLANLWTIYETQQMRENEKSWLQDTINKNEDFLRTWRTPQLHFSDGRWEELATQDIFTDSFSTIRKDITFMKNRLAQIAIEEAADAAEYKRLATWKSENPWTTVNEYANDNN